VRELFGCSARFEAGSEFRQQQAPSNVSSVRRWQQDLCANACVARTDRDVSFCEQQPRRPLVSDRKRWTTSASTNSARKRERLGQETPPAINNVASSDIDTAMDSAKICLARRRKCIVNIPKKALHEVLSIIPPQRVDFKRRISGNR